MLSTTMMNCKTPVTIGTREVWEVDAYDMETYDVAMEDDRLAIAFRLNSQGAKRRPHHVIVHEAQRRAARLAVDVEEDDAPPASYLEDNHEDLCNAECDSDDDGAASDEGSMAFSNPEDFIVDDRDSDRCSTMDTISRLRDTSAKDHGCKRSTGFWKRFGQTRMRVVPECDASEKQSYGQRGKQEQVRQKSSISEKISSMMRRTDHAKRAIGDSPWFVFLRCVDCGPR
eukprot:TRINITY_DN9631_c0_g1_i1.p1 TRINITY_DN9631_c0_g1~~TRINITY_DN9631_c0_g1_i1.p1  ORF type:complete len:228 (+),score=28.00 TRINITY_DN9631_c0_g1_i1:48-731(+)